MTRTLRLFIATNLPAAVVSSVSVMTKDLDADYRSVRWVRAESLHLTLRFLGEVQDERIREIDQSLREIETAPFAVEIAGVGFFPNERAPRVFWAGVASGGLVRLAHAVEQRMAGLGFETANRTFSLHLTLARCRKNGRLDRALVESARRFQDRKFGSFETDRFFLYESRLEPSGAKYTKRREYPLKMTPSTDTTGT